MILQPPITKQPNETFLISIEFSRRLKGAEAISSATITSKKVSDGADSTSVLISGPTFAGSIAQCRLTANVLQLAGEDHVVQVRIGTTSSNTFEAEVKVNIREE